MSVRCWDLSRPLIPAGTQHAYLFNSSRLSSCCFHLNLILLCPLNLFVSKTIKFLDIEPAPVVGSDIELTAIDHSFPLLQIQTLRGWRFQRLLEHCKVSMGSSKWAPHGAVPVPEIEEEMVLKSFVPCALGTSLAEAKQLTLFRERTAAVKFLQSRFCAQERHPIIVKRVVDPCGCSAHKRGVVHLLRRTVRHGPLRAEFCFGKRRQGFQFHAAAQVHECFLCGRLLHLSCFCMGFRRFACRAAFLCLFLATSLASSCFNPRTPASGERRCSGLPEKLERGFQ